MKRKSTQYWLLKTEPGEWSWEDQRSAAGGVGHWDGVKNRQAQNNMRSMREGDLCFFYHSGSDRSVVGVVEVVRPWYAENGEEEEPKAGTCGMVDVRAVGAMRSPVELKDIKAEAESMKGFALLRQPRLSVVPVPEAVWERICEMGGGYNGADIGGEAKEE